MCVLLAAFACSSTTSSSPVVRHFYRHLQQVGGIHEHVDADPLAHLVYHGHAYVFLYAHAYVIRHHVGHDDSDDDGGFAVLFAPL